MAEGSFDAYDNGRGVVTQRLVDADRPRWNAFLETARNATFLFHRDYMEYHADRFRDMSLVIRRGEELLALLPANLQSAHVVSSHQGLTYGGLVVRRDASLLTVLECFQAVLAGLHANGYESLVLKRIPRFYTQLPDDEIDYALFLVNAELVRRDTAMVVSQRERLPFRRGKKSQINKGKRAGLVLKEEDDFAPFWERVLIPRLKDRYGVAPVHSLAEIRLLASRFAGQIRQFSAWRGERILAGITVYETATVAHVQYSSITPEGAECSALDVLLEWLIVTRYADKNWFDFGICNEADGRVLNHALLQSKEGFGARAASHDFYRVPTAAHAALAPLLPTLDRTLNERC